MDIHAKLDLLTDAAQYDTCLEAGQPAPFPGDAVGRKAHARHNPTFNTPAKETLTSRDLQHAVTHVMHGSEKMPVLRVLQTSACEKNCFYCPWRAGRNLRRETLSPDELSLSFDAMQRKGLVNGLFLSSGIIGTHRSQDRMLATVELLRIKYKYQGYIHLKLLPDAEDAHIEQAVKLADRVSVNLEAPNPERLAKLAPKKTFKVGLVETLRRSALYINRLRAEGQEAAPAGMSTQFVVGGADESDREILNASQMLYREVGLARAYYSAFHPVPDTPLENKPAVNPRREHRLYQSDFLLTRYGFSTDEFIFDEQGNLPIHNDPKTLWAEAHPEHFPVEVNQASRKFLLRVPGIGPKGAGAILNARQTGKLTTLRELQQLGIDTQKAGRWLLVAGKRPEFQLSLF